MVAITSIHSSESVWGQYNLCTLTSALMWTNVRWVSWHNIFFLWKKAECKASRKHDHRNSFFSTSFWDLWCSILFRIPQKSKEMRLVSLKPYAHFLNNWEEPCCDQDDFTEVDPGTSNYNRCEITPYLPLKLHWNSEAVCGNNTKRCLSFCLEIFFLLFGFHGGRGAYHICSADKTASVLP